MSRILLSLDNLSVFVPGKVFCEGFSTKLHAGDRIAIVGDNGSGKTTLLKALVGPGVAYVPQVMEEAERSGGEQLMDAIAQAMASRPDVLLLDEPSNHLDRRNRRRLRKMLGRATGAVILVSHDRDLLCDWATTVWHLGDGELEVFHGSYESFVQEQQVRQSQAQAHFQELRDKRQKLGKALDKEATRKARTTKQTKKRYDNDKMMRKGKQGQAERTMGRSHKKRVQEERSEVIEELRALRRPPKVPPRFHLDHGRRRFSLDVRDGALAYDRPIVQKLNFTLEQGDRVALIGDNGSGKSTLLRALLGDERVKRTGEWNIPDIQIGYLDQHYSLLPNGTLEEAVKALQPTWTQDEIARHLAGFLFVHRRWLEVPISVLSGGEKARLSLALIACHTPDLLLLDEVTNNLDMRTKEHLAEVLRAYPGALLITCHEQAFLQEIKTHMVIQTS